MENEEKAREIAQDDSLYGDSEFGANERYKAAMAMAQYKDTDFEYYIDKVLVKKIIYYLDREEKRTGLTLDQMDDWDELNKGFMEYWRAQ